MFKRGGKEQNAFDNDGDEGRGGSYAGPPATMGGRGPVSHNPGMPGRPSPGMPPRNGPMPGHTSSDGARAGVPQAGPGAMHPAIQAHLARGGRCPTCGR